MPRVRRVTAGGYAYHVLNRANRRARIFETDDDYEAFERVLVEAHRRTPVRICAYAVMPNHWHFVLWPSADGEIATFLRWLTQTHTQRWNGHRSAAGTGHLYQGRYKSFLIQQDEHFLTVCQYVESNPVRAGLVRSAADWRWSSAARRARGTPEDRYLLSDWPVPTPGAWSRRANRAPSPGLMARIESSLSRSRPLGDDDWVARVANDFGLEPTLRDRGRPLSSP